MILRTGVCSLLCLAFFLLAGLSACTRQSPPRAVEPVLVLQSEQLHLSANPSVEPIVYIVLRDSTGRAAGLYQRMKRTLAQRGYAITASASQAGYILQFSVVHAGGMSPETARNAVPAGYDGDIGPKGAGACVLMADVLIATRTIPKTGRRQNHVIASTSTRSTIADEQIRVAVMQESPTATFNKVHGELESRMVTAVADMFPPVHR